MMRDCDELIRQYIDWLEQGMRVQRLDGVCEIVTPFLDRHNDPLALYLSEESGRYVLSDDGYVLGDLVMSGVDTSGDRRARILDTILTGFGVDNADGELRVEAGPDNLGDAQHRLIQAMLAVNDLFVLGRDHVRSVFLDDVASFLREHKVRFTTNVPRKGRSGIPHNFDFVVPAAGEVPERYIRAINRPNKDNISQYCWAWVDTIDARPPSSQAYAFLNDEKPVPRELLAALHNYRIEPVPWGEREEVAQKLAA